MSAAGTDETEATAAGPAVLPTLLGLARLLAAPAIAWAVVAGHHLLTVALVTVAAVTDLADGRVARLLHQTTAPGALLDAVADAAVLLALTTALAVQGTAPAWLAVVLAAREIAWVTLVARDTPGGVVAAARSPHAGLGGAVLLAGVTILATTTEGVAPVLRPLAWAVIGWGLALAWLVVALRHDDALVVGRRPPPTRTSPERTPTAGTSTHEEVTR